jgi:hypothetical protein
MKVAATLVLVFVALSTTSCAGDVVSEAPGSSAEPSTSGGAAGDYEVLERPQTREDGIPILMRAEEAAFDVDSLRKVGALEDLAYFAALDKETGSPCLIAFTAGDAMFMECGDAPSLAPHDRKVRSVMLVPDGYPVPTGWEILGPNVIFESDEL